MKRVGVLRGGVGPEYHMSIQTGAAVQQALLESGFEAVDMLLDKNGVLHMKGIPVSMDQVQSRVDHVWNALHGVFGEDGGVSQLLNQYGISYTGSDTAASALSFNKQTAKEQAKTLGVSVPQSILVIPEGGESVSEITGKIYRTMAPPWVIKPLSGGSSVRTFFAFTPLELSQIVEESISYAQPFLVEQYIFGTEVAVGVVDNFRGKDTYTLPVVDIVRPSKGVLEHESRLTDHTNIPSRLRSEEKDKVSFLAKEMHKLLGAKDYSQSEFIIDRFGKIWFIETDTSPHLHKTSPFFKALSSVGATLSEFVKSVLQR